jgi:hypothetical protein
LRTQTGRRHWLLVDEAHHLLPAAREDWISPDNLRATILVTVHLEAVSPDVLKGVKALVELGGRAADILMEFCRVAGVEPFRSLAQSLTNSCFGGLTLGSPPNGSSSSVPLQVHKRNVWQPSLSQQVAAKTGSYDEDVRGYSDE